MSLLVSCSSANLKLIVILESVPAEVEGPLFSGVRRGKTVDGQADDCQMPRHPAVASVLPSESESHSTSLLYKKLTAILLLATRSSDLHFC